MRTDLLESLRHASFTIYTMVSYMLSNTHIIDQFLDKDEIEIEDIFSDVCEIQHISPHTLPRVEPKVDLDIGLKPILTRTTSKAHRYSIDGLTLWFVPPNRVATIASISTNYQLVTKLFITTLVDALSGSTHLSNITMSAQICSHRFKSIKFNMSLFCSTPRTNYPYWIQCFNNKGRHRIRPPILKQLDLHPHKSGLIH